MSATTPFCHDVCYADLGGEMRCLYEVDEDEVGGDVVGDGGVVSSDESVFPTHFLYSPVCCAPETFNSKALFFTNGLQPRRSSPSTPPRPQDWVLTWGSKPSPLASQQVLREENSQEISVYRVQLYFFSQKQS